MPQLASIKDCTGCLACLDACKHQAIQKINKYGHLFIRVENSKCINCGICEKVCPITTFKNQNKIENIHIYGGWCKDSQIRKTSASGGAFSGCALAVLNQNGIVFGATLINNAVKHISINSVDNLHLLQNSKYLQSNTEGIFKQVKESLNQGLFVLFSGTPCQVAALNNFLHKKYENLLTIDLICNGIPSAEAIGQFKNAHKPQNIISFRDKKYGWHSLKSQSITWVDPNNSIIKEHRNDDIFYQIFSAGLTHRRICCHCPFSSIPRQADITIADFWGIKRFKEEWQDGISLIITNNKTGENFIQKNNFLQIFSSSLEECIHANPRLINGKKYHEYHPVILFPSLKKILPNKMYNNIIRNKMPYKLFWAPYKILTIISNNRKIKSVLQK